VHFDGYRTYVRARAETRRRRTGPANTERSAA
jgi:hypothetical protein